MPLPTLSGTGIFGLPMQALRSMLSVCGSFQTWVGVADETDALEFIDIFETRMTPEPTWPRARIWMDANFRATNIGTGAYNDYGLSGRLMIEFEAAVSSQYRDNPGDAFLEFVNTVGEVVLDMVTLPLSDGPLSISEFGIEALEETAEEERESRGHHYMMTLFFQWSTGNSAGGSGGGA